MLDDENEIENDCGNQMIRTAAKEAQVNDRVDNYLAVVL